MMRNLRDTHSTLSAYTRALRHELRHVRMSVRRPNGLADQSGLSASRLRELLRGSEPTECEHHALCRALPRMRFFAVEPAVALAQPAPSSSERAEPDTNEATGEPSDDSTPASADAADASAADAPVQAVPRPRTFGEALRTARRKEMLKQHQLAELMQVTQCTISAWEIDKAIPVASHFEALLAWFPVLRTAPQPSVRDIGKPKGNVYGPGAQALRHGDVARVAPVGDVMAPDHGPESLRAWEEPEDDGPCDSTAPASVTNLSELAMALIFFGTQLGEAKATLGCQLGVVAPLLRAAAAASLTPAQIADVIACVA